MDIETAKSRPIDMRIADATDEELQKILDLRLKFWEKEDRPLYVAGLYYISTVDADYSDEEKALVEGTACALGVGEEELGKLEEDIDEDPDAAIRAFCLPSSVFRS